MREGDNPHPPSRSIRSSETIVSATPIPIRCSQASPTYQQSCQLLRCSTGQGNANSRPHRSDNKPPKHDVLHDILWHSWLGWSYGNVASQSLLGFGPMSNQTRHGKEKFKHLQLRSLLDEVGNAADSTWQRLLSSGYCHAHAEARGISTSRLALHGMFCMFD